LSFVNHSPGEGREAGTQSRICGTLSVMRILILYPGLHGERARLLEPYKWRLRLGRVQVILADDRVHSEDAGVFADVLEMPAAEDAAGAWQVLARYLEKHPVDGIIAQSEPGLLLGARAAREFGLPGPSVEAALSTVNKFDSRTRLAAARVAQPAFEWVGDAQGVRRFASEHGWPVVIKAVASSRQRLVLKVSGEADLEKTVAHMRAELPAARDVRRLVSFAEIEGIDLGLDPFRGFLVEAFQVGRPVECDAVIAGHEPHWFGICEQLICNQPGFIIEGYALPARVSAEQELQALSTARIAVKTLGLSHTGVSVELALAPDGPHIIEVNGRLPWDDGLNELIQASTGCNPGVLMLKVAAGKSLPRVRTRQHAALIYRCQFDEGQLTQVPDPARLKALTAPEQRPLLFARLGDRLLPAEHPDSRPHVAGFLATDPKHTLGAIEIARAGLAGLQLDIQPTRPAHAAPPTVTQASSFQASARS
jgi:biotin carboxylase